MAVGGVPDDAEEEGPGADLPAVEGEVAEAQQGVDQPAVVALVQPDARLVQDVQDAP